MSISTRERFLDICHFKRPSDLWLRIYSGATEEKDLDDIQCGDSYGYPLFAEFHGHHLPGVWRG